LLASSDDLENQTSNKAVTPGLGRGVGHEFRTLWDPNTALKQNKHTRARKMATYLAFTYILVIHLYLIIY